MTVQYSVQKMVSDGTLSTIALGIQYLQRNDIYMRIAGEETPQVGAHSGYTWSFINNTTLKILPVVPNGVEVVVYRRTGVDAMYNVYSQNAQFDEATIDENNQQLLYIAQEYLEQGLPGTGVDTIEYVRDDGSFTYYRMRRTDGSYSEEFTVPSASNSTKVLTRESLRRSYAEAGRNLVDGSFEVGGALVNATDVLLHEASGKAFSGPAGAVAAGTNPESGRFVDRSSVLLRQAVSTVIQVDPFILLAPRVIDGLHSARDYIASIGGGVGILSAKVYLLEDEYIPVDRVIMRGQGIGPSFNSATTLKWAGGAGARKAVVRSSKYPLGTEGSLALSGVGVQNCVIDADGCDIGLYSYYTTNNSDFDGIVTRNATIANTYIIKSWFTNYGKQQAREGKNRGIVIGKALFGETGNIAVNACGWGWMQCKSNGTAVSSYDPAGLSDAGAGLVLGTFTNSNHFPSVQSEGNNGLGVHSAVSFTNSFGSVYLESNSGASSGEKCSWTNVSGGSLTAIAVQSIHLATNQTLKNNVNRGMIVDAIHRGDDVNSFTGSGELVLLGGNLTSFSATDWTKVAKTHNQLLSAQYINIRYLTSVQSYTRFVTHAVLAYPQVTIVPRATITLASPLSIGIDANPKQNYGTTFTANVPVTLRHAPVTTIGTHNLEIGGTLPTVDALFDIYVTIPFIAGSGLQSPLL